MNHLRNPATIQALEHQMSVGSLQTDAVTERWYSEFDGRIQATLTDGSVRLRAYSYDSAHDFPSVPEAAQWLIEEYKRYRARFLVMSSHG